ncbi:hypothetical protein FXV83_33010 [Bradyrhizobium hipponense]|uniref:Uncharacterized protein n=1 Tax=Bradyrhizobium hipponense TaxID=2605638 RepID=A0A5S4YGH4_9BRAD|nr:hypothetical protein [Bradyrhizobium hipponense]TYO62395.1 hypothetical protein FXV83_33010 [Bradyrhizobium hipponense]
MSIQIAPDECDMELDHPDQHLGRQRGADFALQWRIWRFCLSTEARACKESTNRAELAARRCFGQACAAG